MLTYLGHLLADLAGGTREGAAVQWSVAAVLATIWATVGPQVEGFLGSLPVIWVSIFWFLDLVLGSLLAWREHRYDPRRGLYSVVKWLVWLAALLVCWGFRQDGSIFDDFIPPLLEVAILLTEGSSVFRNGAKLLASISGNQEAGVLSRFAGAVERRVLHQLHQLDQLEQPPEGPDQGPSSVPGGVQP